MSGYGDGEYGVVTYQREVEVVMPHLPDNWIKKLMVDLSIVGWDKGKFPHQVVRFFTAWERCEGGSAANNPLNTTNHVTSAEGPWQGADYNVTPGVCNYLKGFYGISATASTLLGGHYDALLVDLRKASTSTITAETMVQNHRTEIRLWGTNPDTMLQVLKGIS